MILGSTFMNEEQIIDSQRQTIVHQSSQQKQTIRLFLLRYGLHLLGRIGLMLSRRDQSNRWYEARCAGVTVLCGERVSHPAPLPLLSFATLFKASARHISPHAHVLEMGAGAGVWSTLCLKRGAQVTATDLPEVDLSGLNEVARRDGKEIKTLHGSLFEGISRQRFDHIFFNPPFHVGRADTTAERAYFGGDGGEVVTEYLKQLPQYLSREGVGWIILPRREREQYQHALIPYHVQVIEQIWLPLLGRVSLLALRPKNGVAPAVRRRAVNPVSECFIRLAQVENTHSCEVVTLQGVLEDDSLREAISTVQSRHLIGRSCLQRGGRWGNKAWTWVTQHPAPPPRLIITALTEEERASQLEDMDESGRWSTRLPDWLLTRLWGDQVIDPEKGPPLEWYLIRGGTYQYLVLIAPHLCTDAFAGANLIEEVLRTYHQLQSPPSPSSIERDEDELRRQAQDYWMTDPQKHLLRRAPLHQRSLIWTRAAVGILTDLVLRGGGLSPSKQGVSASTQRGRTQSVLTRVSQADLQLVLSGARQRGVKAHSLFSWGLLLAIQSWSRRRDLSAPKRLRLIDLCTLRNFLSREDAHDFNIAIQPFTHTLKMVEDDQGALLKIARDLEAIKRGRILIDLARSQIYAFTARFLPLNIVRKLIFKTLFKTNITTTNPGHAPLSIERAGEAEVVDFINFPQIASPAELGIIYTTYRGELRILTLFDSSRWEREEISELVSSLWGEIMRLTEDHDDPCR